MTFIDFFSGVGGFTRGMELAGHKCVGHCEIDKYAEASYRSMHTITDEQRKYLATLSLDERQKEILKEEYLNGEWYANDITGVKPGEIPEADCYCFGFPCQAFSIAGHRRGFEDTRGTLFFEVMRLAKERKPPLLFAENVAGLLNHRGGETFEVIVRSMADLGYIVEWQVLNSLYFGVPQNRERVFIVGHIGTERGREIFPIAADDPKIDKLPGHQVTNTITTRVEADTVGTYVGQTDRQTDRQTDNNTQGERLSQVLIAGLMDYKKPKLSNYTMTLDTKTGSLPGFMTTYVIEK